MGNYTLQVAKLSRCDFTSTGTMYAAKMNVIPSKKPFWHIGKSIPLSSISVLDRYLRIYNFAFASSSFNAGRLRFC